MKIIVWNVSLPCLHQLMILDGHFYLLLLCFALPRLSFSFVPVIILHNIAVISNVAVDCFIDLTCIFIYISI